MKLLGDVTRVQVGGGRRNGPWARGLVSGGSAFAALALLAGCAGSAGSAGSGNEAGGEGFAWDAPQDEVDAAVADHEPVTLTLQAGGPTEDSISGRRTMDFINEVEERSGGKITIEPTWGMAISGYPEAVDATSDGRVDISYDLVSYQPQRFPEASAIGVALGTVPYSPMVGEMVANSVATEMGWNDQALLDRYEEEGVTPLTPILGNGVYSLNCNSEINTAEELKGKQVRAGSAGQNAALTDFGAVPVSMEFTEAYEALQRNTIDCDLSPMSAKEISGVYQAAPHLAYSTEANWPRFSGTYVIGPKYEQLPLAYQQILFDAAATMTSGSAQSYVDSNSQHVEDIASVDGTIEEFDDAFQDKMAEILDEQINAEIEAGNLPEGTIDQVDELTEKWTKRVADLGFEDGGDMEELPEWYSADDDWSAWAKDLWENTGALDHRPGA